MKAFYKVRVIQEPENKSFYVETKRTWLSPWKYACVFRQDNYLSLENAKELAIKHANDLASEQIIYEI